MNDAHSRQFVGKGGAGSAAETVTKRNVLRSELGDGSREVLSAGENGEMDGPRREGVVEWRAEGTCLERCGSFQTTNGTHLYLKESTTLKRVF